MKKVGFFGGTFDPIHIGHLNLAVQILEKKKLDKILFCPAYKSPLKKEMPIASGIDRYNMIKLAIKDFENFEVIDNEIVKEKVSYTIDTLNELKEIFSLNLIISDDALETFNRWKDFKEILKIAPLIVGKRNIFKKNDLNLNEKNFVETDIFEINATNVRKRLKEKKAIKHLLTNDVIDYILHKKLYI
ncbi:MAG: nicotinate (nicotinamide) nucleotide adenylyltransferase [Chlamydiae bacterium RIFCSPHIGHO2_12_FULL_27_8]|nr:MAG: nicotinate (nicotinamide) nucleotide adenylyltransferase [Chlamydiae bacterium RIFCSPHIGHO2_12_FULL_27_8]